MEFDDFNTADAHAVGAELRIKTKDGKETDCYIKLAGHDSPLWQKITRERQRANMIADLTKLDYVSTDAVDYAKATLDWRGFTDNGENLPFSEEKAMQLYIAAPYILEQVDDFISDYRNFTKG